MNKIFYEKPTVELIVVRFEENIMSDGTWNKSIKSGSTWDSSDEDYGLE